MKIIQVINCEPRKDAVLFKHKNTYYLDTDELDLMEIVPKLDWMLRQE